ncbi:palmitoyl-protein thioesterase [Sistotremastrum suecicum HHB10207 ss-3]|uniref:Palmitoyl-protein thioesterase 1 n=1 Tax=Sistotremastrum suecicum HHB10207 ss-3 TaxID=1314776 RepID=A0A166IF63_9AGAM|nr:palmitoyl-protein thioesterase [Sistotremastrum suecicum HHB10207 ss-3]
MILRSLLLFGLVVQLVFASPFASSYRKDVRPLVIWHGLGDSHSSAGMLEFAELIKSVHPGIFIHAVRVEESIEADQRAGWFGNVEEQITKVSEQLASIKELKGGFDAIGFSQGGQFLRAYVEIYNSPPVHNLITFGSQHMGISDIPGCKPGDILCRLAANAARAGVYTSWAQTHLVQAQYFRDHKNLDLYLATNHFLPTINNEVPSILKNNTYKANLVSLSNLVLVAFSEDQTVVPKESSWFGSFAPPDENVEEGTIIPLKEQPLYVEDWIGVRTLDESGRLALEICEGRHMALSRACWEPLVTTYAGGSLRAKDTLVVQS